MRVLVIGSGGREHALVHTFWRQGHKVYCYPGNPGMWAQASLLSATTNLLDEYSKLTLAVKEMKIDLTVVGSEVHLERGIQDFFSKLDLPLFGPSKEATMLESSKAWAKKFMAKYKIPTAAFEVVRTADEARTTVKRFLTEGSGAVIKASGLAGGKGVVCCHTFEEADSAIHQILEEKIYGSTEVVIEELLEGPEISLQTISDGETIFPLLAAQDHKRLYDGNQGPNTGGMGAYAPLPFLDAAMQKEIEETILLPTLAGLAIEKIPYLGILYFGLMITKSGPKLLEYNCRFGDPEAQAVLPLLETDLAEMMMAAIEGNLSSIKMRWSSKSCSCVVMSVKGYPVSPILGCPIERVENGEDLFFFHAGTAIDKQGKLVTAGGRVLGVSTIANRLEEATSKAYEAIDALQSPWAHYRRDIGSARI